MLYYSLVFLIIGLIAGALGIYGVAAVASQIAWVLFLIWGRAAGCASCFRWPSASSGLSRPNRVGAALLSAPRPLSAHAASGMEDDRGSTGRTAAWLEDDMLFLVFLLVVLWFLGLMTSYTLGGLLHILLVIAIILFLVHVIQGNSIGEA